MASISQSEFERIETEWNQFRQNNETRRADRSGAETALKEVSVRRVKELALLAVVFR